MTGVGDAPLRAWLPAFLVVSLAWGSSFLFIAIALREFTPVQVGFGRVAIGAVVLLGMVAWTKNWPHLSWKNVGAIAIVAVFMSGIPLVLIPMAEQQITSTLASLLNASTPLWTALFVALLIPAEKVNRLQLTGLVIGALGIAVLLGAWNVHSFPLLGAGLMLGATACYGIGGTLSRVLLNRVQESNVTLAATQIGLSALMLAPFVLVSPAPAPSAFELSSGAMWALIALGVLGTSFAYVLFWRVVKVAGATTAASVTYVVPVVATFLGVVVLGDHLPWYELAGAGIVFVGVALAGRKKGPVMVAEEGLAAQPAIAGASQIEELPELGEEASEDARVAESPRET
ncbi:DMT family transporter [Demequina aurantiaca]|uniref:DMT family transporter n=1 Tax=Demequina aurantiaca TaxID=676200 RepID=UPI00078632A8|nr:DMT family transporter [Demequina aurantiaca]